MNLTQEQCSDSRLHLMDYIGCQRNCSSLIIHALSGESQEWGKKERGAKGNLKSNSALSHSTVNTQKLKQEAGKSLMIHISYKTISWMFSPAGERLWQTQRIEKHSYLLLLTACIWWQGTSSNWADLISHLDSLTSYMDLEGMGWPPDMSPDTAQVQVHRMFRILFQTKSASPVNSKVILWRYRFADPSVIHSISGKYDVFLGLITDRFKHTNRSLVFK